MSAKLAAQIQLALGEIAQIRMELAPLIAKPPGHEADNMERAAACAMLHSFYTQIEKAFELIAREWDGGVATGESWHIDLLKQMARPTPRRQAVILETMLPDLREFLAFRHLFRGASIMLMRWEKLVPLLNRVDSTTNAVTERLCAFIEFLDTQRE